MLRFSLFTILLLNIHLTTAQTKDDIIAVIKSASELPELEPLFQVEMNSGPTMVLAKSDRLSSGSNVVEKEFWSLTSDDFWGFDRPVRIMTEQEANFEGVEREKMVSLSISFAGDQCNLGFTSTLEEGTRFFQGWISLDRSGFDWKVTGKNIRSR